MVLGRQWTLEVDCIGLHTESRERWWNLKDYHTTPRNVGPLVQRSRLTGLDADRLAGVRIDVSAGFQRHSLITIIKAQSCALLP